MFTISLGKTPTMGLIKSTRNCLLAGLETPENHHPATECLCWTRDVLKRSHASWLAVETRRALLLDQENEGLTISVNTSYFTVYYTHTATPVLYLTAQIIARGWSTA